MGILIFWQPFVLLPFWGKDAEPHGPASPPAASSSSPYFLGENTTAHAVTTATRVKISTDDEFDREALHLVKMNLQQQEKMPPEAGKHVPCGGILRCALLSSLTLKACLTIFREVYDEVTEQEGGAPVTLMFLSSAKCWKKTTTNSKARDFLEGSNRSIMDRLSSQISRMRKKAEASGLRFPSSQTLYAGVLKADARRSANVSSNFPSGLSHMFGSVFSDVQVLSVRYLPQSSLVSFSALEESVAAVVGAATTTYVLMSPSSSPLRALASTEALRKVATKQGCAFIHLRSDIVYEWNDGSPLGALVVRIRCPKRLFTGEGKTLHEFPPGYRMDTKEGVTPPLLCEHLPQRIRLSRAIKYGSKTAIFHGQWREQNVIVKLFHPYQYFSFRGFHDFVHERRGGVH
ncbi:transferase [Trypanosoma rangeli]|uniref:Transferase n=1 Tax=Trypanosoma rangeli TaxID=5698 RepID=A0A3R7P433_TRYRA|nr:transferase [Trypanosoma rangeli]RNF12430.1 transferase [Trypanosoma rangeli]|eukprot:RNF12430.1 transferase [Trypanosoma rangeli]